ncbi:hypothetical protein BC826DRAFT_148745 [Russula brevipes]|nr:hypothetical protein BC826DRAFT_148745 [Russula brevipes]
MGRPTHQRRPSPRLYFPAPRRAPQHNHFGLSDPFVLTEEGFREYTNTSPGRPTSPSGERAGRASPAGTTSGPGDRTARTPTAAHGSSERPRRSRHGSGTRSSRTDIISVATGSWSAHWPAAIGKDTKCGGAPESSGAWGSSSPATAVRVNHGIPQDGRVAILTVFRV